MYANMTYLMFKSEDDLRQAQTKLEALLPQTRQAAGFRAFYAIRTGERDAALMAIYDSRAQAEAAGAQLAPRVGEAVREHVAGPPRRAAGEVVAHS